MKVQSVLPVILSILVIIAVAVIERHSKFAAAITATMPLSATLALWIVYSANEGSNSIMQDFTQGLILGIIPTVGFIVAVWVGARAGQNLLPMLAIGYGAWAVLFGVSVAIKNYVGL